MTSTRVTIPRALTVATSVVKRLVDASRGTHGARLYLEIEDLCATRFAEYTDMFSRFAEWDSAADWVDVHEYVYMVGGKPVQTTVHMGSRVIVRHSQEQSLDSVCLHVPSTGNVSVHATVETHVSDADVPETVTPTSVRMYRERTWRSGPWQFTCVRAWSGKSRTEAERTHAGNRGTSSVRICFEPDEDYWAVQHHTSLYVATSMLIKMFNVIGGDMVPVDVVSHNPNHDPCNTPKGRREVRAGAPGGRP
jgi:hypothetical protein